MVKGKVDVKKRINVLMDVWNNIIEYWEESGGSLSRSDVTRILMDAYNRESIKPLKGAANPADLYDKELASLYVVGRYGMGLEEQYPDIFDKIFREEIKYENVINIMSKEPLEIAREKIKVILGDVDDNTLSRILRLKLTEVFFNFSSKDELINLIKTALKIYPEKSKTIKNYIKFYIAFKIAEAISNGEVRDRISKEALKHALALEFKLEKKGLPDDSYIRMIAREVFNIPEKILNNILTARSLKHKKF
ncbi:MAG: DUF2192 domain-containing protein [Acidilobaceae archaeon]